MRRPDPLPRSIQEAPPDQGNRGSDEDHECPARGSPPDVERNNKGCHRPRGRAIPLKHGQEQFAHTVPISSRPIRSEEHTSELQSLMRTSYAVFCLKQKTNT